MGKVAEHQNTFLSKLKELLLNYEGITYVNFFKSKYISIKRNDKVILSIYFRASETRFYVDDNVEMLALYEMFLKDGKVYQHDTAAEDNVKGKLAFYSGEKYEMQVVKGYLDIV